MQLRPAWEGSASVADAADAVAVAPVADMFWRRAIDPPSELMKLTIGVGNA